jgi:hypothetical protein
MSVTRARSDRRPRNPAAAGGALPALSLRLSPLCPGVDQATPGAGARATGLRQHLGDAGAGAARPGHAAAPARLSHGAGQRDVPRPVLLPGAARKGAAAPADLSVAEGLDRRLQRGEELYSLAILFREEGLYERTLFYATDINPEALRAAEAGVYSLDRIRKFTENHQKSGGKSSLSDYYTADYGRAVFDKTCANRVVFSDHSLVTDAVFAEMHLISCRNVMIYFDRELQDRAIGLFRDSLARKGFLGLGSKESLRFSAHAAAFSDFVPAEKIYQRREP